MNNTLSPIVAEGVEVPNISEVRKLQEYLDSKVEIYNNKNFISDDPISIPHSFSVQQDIEISGFFASIFAWGNRKIIIKKCRELMAIMDNSPYDFILNHTDSDLLPLKHFKHRTFNYIDALYFIKFLNHHYKAHSSLESAFLTSSTNKDNLIEKGLVEFNRYFFSLPDYPSRTRKHIASPLRNSACKKLNMFLRWMVRKDDRGVDFGIWNKLSPRDLIIPCDVHVLRVSTKLGLLDSSKANWKSAIQITDTLKKLNPEDPTIYDFAIFGMGVEKVL